jgi:serine/threonine protein kinase
VDETQRRVTVYRAADRGETGGALIVITSGMTWEAFVEKVASKLCLVEHPGTAHLVTLVVATPDGAAIDEVEALRDGDRLAVSRVTRTGGGDIRDSNSSGFQNTDLAEIHLGAAIGNGSFGTVYRGRWRGTEVAIKKLSCSAQAGALQAVEDFRTEIATLGMLRHPNIVLFLGAVTEPPELCLVTEFVERGNLFDLLHEEDGRSNGTVLSTKAVVTMALDVCRGMAYLHGFQPPLLHRDLKSSNLLCGPGGSIKICDFGLSTVANVSDSTEMQDGNKGRVCGTAQWMAPEILQHEVFTGAADVYSFGVVLGEMISGEVPWRGLNAPAVAVRVCLEGLRPDLPPGTPSPVADLTARCVHEFPTSRPAFRELLELLSSLLESSCCDGVDAGGRDDGEVAPR